MAKIKSFYSFQEDLGAPMVHETAIIGLLTALPENPRKSSIFIDVYKSLHELKHLFEDRVFKHRYNLPRRKARYDNIQRRHRRATRNSSFPVLNS